MSDGIARMTTESIKRRITILREHGHDRTPGGRRLIAALESVLIEPGEQCRCPSTLPARSSPFRVPVAHRF
jgi:hypothetical protein